MAIIVTFSIEVKVKLRNGTPFIGYSVFEGTGTKELLSTDLNKEFLNSLFTEPLFKKRFSD